MHPIIVDADDIDLHYKNKQKPDTTSMHQCWITEFLFLSIHIERIAERITNVAFNQIGQIRPWNRSTNLVHVRFHEIIECILGRIEIDQKWEAE